MTRQELDKKLKKAEWQLEKHNYLEAKKLLRQVEQYKPVSLRTIALSAKYALMMDDCMTALNRLDTKWWLHFAYEGMDEVFQIYEQIWKEKWPNEREFARAEYTRKWLRAIGTETEEARELQQQMVQLTEWSKEYYYSGLDAILEKIEFCTYTRMEVVWNYLIQLYFQAKGKSDAFIPGTEWIDGLRNMGYIRERIQEQESVFLLIAEESNEAMCRAIGKMLRELGKTVYVLTAPEEVDKGADRKSLLHSSLNSRETDSYGIDFFPTYFFGDESDQYMDNRALLIQHLSEQAPEQLVTVLGSGCLLDDLGMQDCLRKSFSRFNLYLGDIFEENFSAGWAGNYLSYISKIYNYDVSTSLQEQDTNYRYSIVIPARNSVASLRHTLKTCLELDYPKDAYEIVISDNSTGHNAEVYKLCQELQDPRIHYYRTPRDLHLPKSFEYAFLQAKGEFIFSIGSDDAVLPWALKVLDAVRREYPQEEVIQWERGFYAWPGFNGGQENQFVIPRAYEQGNYGAHYRNSREYLKQVLHAPDSMYGLPMLYINSGFKRSYMSTLLEKTGRLWDGVCQDIYMGVVNILINEQILNVRYSLTIAGMTGSSVGATCVQAHTEDSQLLNFYGEVRQTSNVGGFSLSMTERLMPELRSDVSSLYNSLLRAAARGILPEEYVWETLDWKKMFIECIQKLDVRDLEYDKLIHYARYTASWHGDEFLQWFDEAIYNKVMEPRLIDEQQLERARKQKTYQEGHTAEGGSVVDASRYGVTNSYEAVRLFRERSGLR